MVVEARKIKPLPKHLTRMKKRPSHVWRNKDVSYHQQGCMCDFCLKIRNQPILPEHLEVLTFPNETFEGKIDGMEPVPTRGERQSPPMRKLGAAGFQQE